MQLIPGWLSCKLWYLIAINGPSLTIKRQMHMLNLHRLGVTVVLWLMVNTLQHGSWSAKVKAMRW